MASLIRALSPPPFDSLKIVPVPVMALEDEDVSQILITSYFNPRDPKKNVHLLPEQFVQPVIQSIMQGLSTILSPFSTILD